MTPYLNTCCLYLSKIHIYLCVTLTNSLPLWTDYLLRDRPSHLWYICTLIWYSIFNPWLNALCSCMAPRGEVKLTAPHARTGVRMEELGTSGECMCTAQQPHISQQISLPRDWAYRALYRDMWRGVVSCCWATSSFQVFALFLFAFAVWGLGFVFCVFVVGWSLGGFGIVRSEWPFILYQIFLCGRYLA